ncbi:MAG TPA: DUF2853 family protein [Saprospiraceae bacterium]|nr:DUF2853 family protein [Saprospiraceae bacterium]
MSKFDDAIATYENTLSDTLGIKDYDSDLLKSVAKGLGPSIYNTDSSKVSCGDDKELETVKNNFLVKKLGLDDREALMEAIKEVCEQMGSSNRNKYRAVFYYLLVKKFNKESVYA